MAGETDKVAGGNIEVDTKLVSSRRMLENLAVARSCVVTLYDAQQYGTLTSDSLKIQKEGHEDPFDHKVMILSGRKILYGQSLKGDRLSGLLDNLEEFADGGAADKLILLKGLYGGKPTPERGTPELIEYLASIINQADRPMMLAATMHKWHVSRPVEEHNYGEPENLLREFQLGVTVNADGFITSHTTLPQERSPSRLEALNLVARPQVGVRQRPEVEVPQGHIQLGH